MSEKTTLTQHLQAEGSGQAANDPDLLALIEKVGDACKQISVLVNRGELAGILGEAGSENIQGEDQKKLDLISNDVFIETLESTGYLGGMASEEMDHMHPIADASKRGKYLITFDPLDGSSNIDVNGSVGTIFSILKSTDDAVADGTFLQAGTEQVCAGYCLYSSATMMVLTCGDGTHGFTLDNQFKGLPGGEFVLTHPSITIPKSTDSYSINAAYTRHWHTPVKRYIDELVAGSTGPRERDFNMRWAGAMVGDVHRILCKGGIFMYPGDAKLDAKGMSGKLRLLYEANPMSFIMEQAGGLSSTGVERIMDLQPQDLHQRVPVIMGSTEEVERVVSYHNS